MKTYRNSFEIFGDPAPVELESAADYARELLFFYKPAGPGEYWIEYPTLNVGYSNEIQWLRDLWDDAEPEPDEDLDDDQARRRISESRLLYYLEKVVEEVPSYYTCAYCSTEISSKDAHENEVPALSDINRWAELAALHAPCCDWIQLHTEQHE